MRSNSGFTLIELFIVVAITGILAAVILGAIHEPKTAPIEAASPDTNPSTMYNVQPTQEQNSRSRGIVIND